MEQSVSRVLKEFGHRIRHQRQAHDLNQQQIAEQVGISRVWLSKIERGQVPGLSLSLAEKLGRILGVKIPDWMSSEKEEDPLPRGLQQFAEEANLPEGDAEMLSKIHYRGKQPTTKKEWRILYQLIQTLVGEEGKEER